jgi:hypothetical protein
MAGGQPLLNPLMQAHLSATWVMPGPSRQGNLDFGLATFGVYQSHLGFAVLLPVLVAIANPESGD